MKRYLFFLKYFFYKPKTFAFTKYLESNCKLSSNQIEENSFNKFLNIFSFAFQHSNFYNRKYIVAGITPELIKTKNDLKKIPVLTKQEVKENSLEMLTVSPKHNDLGKGATGGSTGTPMEYYSNKRLPLEAFAWRYLSWWGINPWDDGAYIWRMTRKGKLENFINQLAWWPVKKLRFDATFLDDNTFRQFAKKINEHKPKLIQGYVGAIFEFALYLEKNNIKINRPKAIWVTSAPVAEFQRKIIEKVFSAPLYDEYGSSEIPWIAAQCRNKNFLHINSEGRYLEITNPDENGFGDVVITDLMNYHFPLIRYELNDRTRFINELCSCGCNLPLIDSVRGRTGESIIIPEVGKIDASYLTTIFDTFPNAVYAFQIIQHKDFNITLKIVPNHSYLSWKSEVENVYKNLTQMVKGKLKIIIEECTEIKSNRGKSRFIIRES